MPKRAERRRSRDDGNEGADIMFDPPTEPADSLAPMPLNLAPKLIGYRCMKSPEGVIPLASYCDPCPDDVPVYEGEQ